MSNKIYWIGGLLLVFCILAFKTPTLSFAFPADYCVPYTGSACETGFLDPNYEEWNAWAYTEANFNEKLALSDIYLSEKTAEGYTCYREIGLYDDMSNCCGNPLIQDIAVLCECEQGYGLCPIVAETETNTSGSSTLGGGSSSLTNMFMVEEKSIDEPKQESSFSVGKMSDNIKGNLEQIRNWFRNMFRIRQ